jgi:hypothetical protein
MIDSRCNAQIPQGSSEIDYAMQEGVFRVFKKTTRIDLHPVRSLQEFFRHYLELKHISNSGPVKSFCFKRLSVLQVLARGSPGLRAYLMYPGSLQPPHCSQC